MPIEDLPALSAVRKTVKVIVRRHNAISLTDADADRILRDMGFVLQNSDAAGDIATQVEFTRNGPVQILPATVARVIQTKADWDTLMRAGTGIKVVQAIRWCGGPGGAIIGCAPVGSLKVNIAVVRFTANQEGILWAHEYGHNAGLRHRSDNGRAIMFPSIDADHNLVNIAESRQYLAGPLAVSNAMMVTSACCGDETMELAQDVREFVSKHWIEGVPYRAASSYTEEDAALLLEWLFNEPEKHEEFLPEIVTTLCFIGSNKAVKPLIDFVKTTWASQAVFNAKNAVLIHFGDLINKSGSRLALDFLTSVATDREVAIKLATPQVLMAAEDGAAAPGFISSVEDLGSELAVSAIFGLSLSSAASAATTIEQLIKSPTPFTSVNQAAEEAALIFQSVRIRGHEAYYRTRSEDSNRQ